MGSSGGFGGSLELVVDDGLGAGLDTGDVVSHGVEAGLSGVDLDDLFELGLAPLELLLPESTLGLAFLENEGLGVLALLNHLGNVSRGGDVGSQRLGVGGPAWGEISGDSVTH
eukprot:CAMPEP_0168610860 /NCGR_PEP_ID=MMETSP0449_2-20121227/2026_1 /TAXON_ID=1082188 /ORGANISM="Strombidium rassoulzadegani, Strain ras09" /LENGTH=112 /DNA_ID=CAMNT_0008651221 /DNA_START=76 /DNA_END=415 /DNA_ORIENTATION=+